MYKTSRLQKKISNKKFCVTKYYEVCTVNNFLLHFFFYIYIFFHDNDSPTYYKM